MDLSALIFIALAGAWAVYLIPKALTAHEADEETRSVEDFSDRMRVLARREAGDTGDASLVVTGRTPRVEPPPVPEPSVAESEGTPEIETPVATRGAAARAAARRRRVLGVVLVALAGTAITAGIGTIGWAWVAIPATLLGAWLVACRLMVKQERAVRASQRVRKPRRTLADEVIAEEDAADGPGTEEIPAIAPEAPPAAERGWDPVPITLPTYVEKAPAGRTVRTIDLDSTGVWSSGRNEADSQLAREAEQAQQAQREEGSEAHRRASGD
ncbi:hypothetical protein KUV85_10740 [Nocardioides panacisoli]|uniref:divisome protein SepX/GlpR n=1 Tax=Nocardioides panacisoli TaxID=627624 RepID=UPI001C638545|nr:hypothetical protein [Nocardioides panacisoli]QYJ02815.1 hypothetical protein KUV85_10740 [Nocardioides panacisoli]